MKKFLIAAVAASVLATPAMAAPNRYDNHGPQNRIEQRHDNRGHVTVRKAPQQKITYRSNWKKGQRFDSRYARNYRVINQPRAYGLRAAPRGYRWVQSGNDAVLIGITSGIVASIMSHVIR